MGYYRELPTGAGWGNIDDETGRPVFVWHGIDEGLEQIAWALQERANFVKSHNNNNPWYTHFFNEAQNTNRTFGLSSSYLQQTIRWCITTLLNYYFLTRAEWEELDSKYLGVYYTRNDIITSLGYTGHASEIAESLVSNYESFNHWYKRKLLWYSIKGLPFEAKLLDFFYDIISKMKRVRESIATHNYLDFNHYSHCTDWEIFYIDYDEYGNEYSGTYTFYNGDRNSLISDDIEYSYNERHYKKGDEYVLPAFKHPITIRKNLKFSLTAAKKNEYAIYTFNITAVNGLIPERILSNPNSYYIENKNVLYTDFPNGVGNEQSFGTMIKGINDLSEAKFITPIITPAYREVSQRDDALQIKKVCGVNMFGFLIEVDFKYK